MKRVISLILCIATVLCISSPSYAVTKRPKSENLTVSSYIEWLEKQITSNDNPSLKSQNLDSDSPEATLKAFRALSQEKKEKFIYYLSNEKVNKMIVDALTESSSTISLENGDINIISVTSTTPLKSSTQTYKSTYNRFVKILGIKVVQLTIWVKYTCDDTYIHKILGGNGTTTKKYNPLQQIKWSGITTYKTDTTATCEADVDFGVGPIKELEAQQYSANIGVTGKVNSPSTGWFDVYD